MSARKALRGESVPQLEPEECEDFANWQLDNICRSGGRSNTPGGRVLQSEHMAISGSRHLRGADQTERIFIVVMVLTASGWSEKEACVFVASHPNVQLGRSKRGRPTNRSHSSDLTNRIATVRTIVNRFNRSDPVNLLRSRIGMFRWQRENGILVGSKYPEDSGPRMQKAYRRRLASLGIGSNCEPAQI